MAEDSERRVTTTVFPGKYVQGPGALARLASLVEKGARALVVSGCGGRTAAIVDRFVRPQLGDTAAYAQLAGECTQTEIDRIAKLATDVGAAVVVAVGGGKVIDAVKAAGEAAGRLKTVVCPTIASSDAPCSALAIVYSVAGEVAKVIQCAKNPDVVLVDTRVICAAPTRFLAAGIGDALATFFEADSCRQSRAANCASQTDAGSLAAYALARLCYDTIREHGELALAANDAHVAVDSFEKVVEANTLLSGIGFESAGLGAAHSIHDGLTALPETRPFLHGEKVAIGVLAGLFLTAKPAALVEEVFGFCERVRLPTVLADIGIADASREKLAPVAAKAVAPGTRIHNEPHRITAAAVIDALLMADAFGRSRRRSR